MLIDCLRETMVERRMDVSDWRAGIIVQLRESQCTNKRKRRPPFVPWKIGEALSNRREMPDPMTSWRVYPIMRAGQGDDLLHARIRNTGRWIAFRQGLDPVATERELRALKLRDRWIACVLLSIFIVEAIVHFFG